MTQTNPYEPKKAECRWHHEERGNDRGSALIMALFMMIFVVGIVISGTSILKSSRTRTETAFLLTGQASQFARSGMTEAINWFRRQDKQPVLAFAPALDAAADPQILDTEEPDIGLVREFKIHGTIWGRYEVWKQWDADPDATRLLWRKQMQAEDVALDRGSQTPGSVWRLRCVGYVYDKRDDTKAFDERPNRIMASEILEAEISRMAFALPGQAAICSRNGSGISIKKNGRLFGGSDGAGAYYELGTGSPTIQNGEINGVPATSPSAIYNDSVQYVFGASYEGLRSMADHYIQDEKDFPTPVVGGSITFLDGNNINIVFTKTRSLIGSGVVVINGNVTVNAGSQAVFNGLLYVDGNLTMNAPCEIRGAVIVTGSVSMQGIGDFADVFYDDKSISNLQATVANYRMSRSARRVSLPD